MYNYQTFRRQQSLQKQIQTLKKEHELIELKRERSSPALVHAHKKRIQGFVLSASDKPIVINQYRDNPHEFRNINGEGILGAKGLYLRRESRQERIDSWLKKNAFFDNIPFKNSSSHQFRQSNGKGMYYKSFSHNFRIKQYLDRQTLNYLPNTIPKFDKLIKKFKYGQKVDLQKLHISINRNLLPILHQKTYFKSVSTLFTEIPARQETIEGVVSNQEGLDQNLQKKVMKPADHMSRKENSREVLVKCGVLRQKIRG